MVYGSGGRRGGARGAGAPTTFRFSHCIPFTAPYMTNPPYHLSPPTISPSSATGIRYVTYWVESIKRNASLIGRF